jgi:hypothetical protein
MSAPRQFDTPLRWFVASRSRGKNGVEHLVDLAGYDGNGVCSCEHFTFSLDRKLQQSKKPSDETRCFHIIEARKALADLVIEKKRKQKGK